MSEQITVEILNRIGGHDYLIGRVEGGYVALFAKYQRGFLTATDARALAAKIVQAADRIEAGDIPSRADFPSP